MNLPGVGQIFEEDAPETVTALIEQFVQLTFSLELITQKLPSAVEITTSYSKLGQSLPGFVF